VSKNSGTQNNFLRLIEGKLFLYWYQRRHLSVFEVQFFSFPNGRTWEFIPFKYRCHQKPLLIVHRLAQLSVFPIKRNAVLFVLASQRLMRTTLYQKSSDSSLTYMNRIDELIVFLKSQPAFAIRYSQIFIERLIRTDYSSNLILLKYANHNNYIHFSMANVKYEAVISNHIQLILIFDAS
jgi:hypothetical protein